MQNIIVYITVPSMQVGADIMQALLEKHLIACANILPEGTSLYMWEGALQKTQESICICKTVQSKYKDIEQVVASLHPYDIPCIVAFPITLGLPAFMQWMEAETCA